MKISGSMKANGTLKGLRMLLASNINIGIREMEEGGDAVKRHLLKKLKVKEEELISFRILRESIDARKKPDIYINMSILASVRNEDRVLKKAGKDVARHYREEYEEVIPGKKKLRERPVVVGFGPAGMFCALILSEAGLKPLVIERGSSVEKRTRDVEDFWRTGVLNTSSNVQFGEGGAGTFSDGKLTTRIKDMRIEKILNILKDSGAPEDILFKSKPHVGTDILKGAVMNIRKRIISLGGEIRFDSLMEDITVRNGKVTAVTVNGDTLPAEAVIIAPGHSARDTYRMLFDKGVMMESKSFAVGFRVEHLREEIDKNQFGGIESPYLKSSEYTLTAKTSTGRGVYSFCMCPGGLVVNSSSEEGHLCVNGMSYHARDKINSNSAIVSTVGPMDFGNHPLDGIKFQEEHERKAYILGGGNFNAPVMNTSDFLTGNSPEELKRVMPTVKPGYKITDLKIIYSEDINKSIKEAMTTFGRKIKGFDTDGIFTGIETRTSSPLRILRNENHESVNIKGIYPAGEGAGYAGGIMSAAVDGIKAAEMIIREFGSLE